MILQLFTDYNRRDFGNLSVIFYDHKKSGMLFTLQRAGLRAISAR